MRYPSASFRRPFLKLVPFIFCSAAACSGPSEEALSSGATTGSGGLGASGGTGASAGGSGPGAAAGGGSATGGMAASGGAAATGGASSESSPLRALLPESEFQKMFPIMNPSSPLQADFATCDGKAKSVATYEGLIEAATHFPEFAGTGDEEMRKREVAAFFANVSQETTGAWAEHSPAEAAQWGLCFVDEGGGWYQSDSSEYPPVVGQSYHGRGPLQLSYNHNYGRFSEHFFGDKNVLLNDPAQLLSDPAVFWGSAIFFWMSEDVAPGEQFPEGEPSAGGLDGVYYKPSCHMVMTESWTPRASDVQKNRTFGLGVAINVINGGLECGGSWNSKAENRVLFYETFAGYLGVASTPEGWIADDYLSCKTQTNFSQP